MIDIPKPSQRSIIAFCDCSGQPIGQPPSWVKITSYRTGRAGLRVSSLTTVTLLVNGSSEAIISQGVSDASVSSKGIKVVVRGSEIDVYAYYYNTMYSYLPFGYYDRGVFTLTATTAGDPARGIVGCTKTFDINVLLLGADWPFFETEHGDQCIYFRADHKFAEYSIVMNKAASMWEDVHANTGFNVQGTGGWQKIVSSTKVNGEYADSGLILRREGFWAGEQPRVSIEMASGAHCLRPGIYRISLDPMRTHYDIVGGGHQVVAPFHGGNGETVICVCVYEPYQNGNLVVTFPTPIKTVAPDTFCCTHSPAFGAVGYEWGMTRAQFVHYKTPTYEHWSAVVPERNSDGTQIIHYWYYRVQKLQTLWALSGYKIERRQGDPASGYVDDTTYAALSRSAIASRARYSSSFAVAKARGFDDEQPPKQGWKSFENEPEQGQQNVSSVTPCPDGTYSGTPSTGGGSGSGSGGGISGLFYYYRYAPVEVEGAVDHYEVYVFVFEGTVDTAELDELTLVELKEHPALIEWMQLDDVTELPGE